MLIHVIKEIFKRVELLRYDEYTMECYFRKKGYFVGRNNRLYINSFGSEPYLIKIGNHCTITAGVSFITHDGGCWVFREEMPELIVFGKIEIKDNCFIGMNSIILLNVTIGPNSVVGAGSVVTNDVPPNTVVAGVPAKEICSTEEYKEKCVRKWRALHLNWPRKELEKQLIEHFWPNENNKRKIWV